MSDAPAVTLVISDLDGTLVDKQKKLSQATIDAVDRLRAAGIGFTIISARPRSGMMPIAAALDLDAPMGAFNGGTIFHRDGTVLMQQRIDPEIVHAMFALVGDAAVDRWLFADDHWHASTDHGLHVDHERIASDRAPIVTTDFTPLYDRADKLTFVSDDPVLLGGLHDRARAAFGDRATVAQSQTYYLDVTALRANKGDGIAQLAAAMHTPLGGVAVIGDQYNDLPMFARAGLAIAMGQAPAEVRAQARYTTASNEDDGVAHAIDEIVLAPG